MYQRKNQIKAIAKVARPGNTLYYYSVALVLVLCLLAFSPASAALSVNINKTSAQSNFISAETVLPSIGFRKANANSKSKQAMRHYNDSEFVIAFRLWLPLAQDDVVDAQFYTAMMYDMGKGVPRSPKDAVHWYQAAAKAGNHHAQHNLGVAYADGEGIERDLKKAIYWWQLSASHGNTDSQYNLGMLYAMGNKTIKRDFGKAHKWWSRAASSGDAMAQYNLGSLFANGDGVIKNYCEAVKWWQKSAKNGFSQASMALQLIVEKDDYKACW